jgi:hypothetical protein
VVKFFAPRRLTPDEYQMNLEKIPSAVTILREFDDQIGVIDYGRHPVFKVPEF